MRPPSIIEAPSHLGLSSAGVAGLPDALRSAGLLEGVAGPRHEGRLEVPSATGRRDPGTGARDVDGIGAFSISLADRVAAVLDRGRFPLVLGGDCSILLGPVLALRRRGRYGLFFIDGHADFYSPESEPNGELASMELAVVTGREPAALADLEGLGPLVREEDVAVFGFRDAAVAAGQGSPDIRSTTMNALDLDAVRRAGPARAARSAVAALEWNGVAGFWIHLDADALHDRVMPAVDYRLPGGLWPEELTAALAVALASPLAVGMEVTIYNPDLDSPDRPAARALAAAITRAFLAAG
jgi:arginase